MSDFVLDERGPGLPTWVYLDGQLVGSVAPAGRGYQMVHVARRTPETRDAGLRLLNTIKGSQREALALLAQSIGG
jgi:hypothetical protein